MSENLFATTDSRPRFTFRVPESERTRPDDPTTLTFVEVRVSDETECQKIAEAAGLGIPGYLVEIAKRAVVAINGQPIDWGSPSGSNWYERCGPKVRACVKRGYNKVHSPSDAGADAFLESMVVENG